MSHPKVKTESYQNLGGINSKVSPYLTGPHEFLDLVNWDFQTPGSLTTRWGSTQYTSQNFGQPINSLYNFMKTTGFSTIIVGTTAGVWAGDTTGQFQGFSFTTIGSTQGWNVAIHFLTQLGTAGLTDSIVGGIDGPYGSGILDRGATLFMNPNPININTFDTESFNNVAFMADGAKLLKFDGSLLVQGYAPFAMPTDQSFIYPGPSERFFPIGRVYNIYTSYQMSDGSEGPLMAVARLNLTAAAATIGGTFISAALQFNTPLNRGIQGVNVYVGYGGSSTAIYSDIYDYPSTFVRNVPVTGSTLQNIDIGFGTTATAYGTSFDLNVFDQPPISDLTGINPWGLTTIFQSFGLSYGAFIFNPVAPRYLENYQNRMFQSGFSLQPSYLYFSETAEPSAVNIDSFIDVRTNDGDRVTTLKAYNSKLMIFKKNSFHELAGDTPDNFNLRQVSDEYGCLSNRATAVYNDTLLFLDRKGVCVYNGANVNAISTKIQPLFEAMNVDAAIDQATMVHDKTRNQILLGVPISGSLTNNVTIVWDYIADAWTKYEGYNPKVFSIMQGRLGTRTAFYGSYSGIVAYFGASFVGDNGSGYTCLARTRFLAQYGQSIETQYRRLYLNVDPIVSATVPIGIQFQSNYGTSFVAGFTMYANPFQSRIDFGIPAKSLAFQSNYFASTLGVKWHGWVLESRYQRAT